jgi:hypothetical protein
MKFLILIFCLFLSVLSFANDCNSSQDETFLNYYMRVNTCFKYPATCKHLNLTTREAKKAIYEACGCLVGAPSKNCPQFRLNEIMCNGKIINYECFIKPKTVNHDSINKGSNG